MEDNQVLTTTAEQQQEEIETPNIQPVVDTLESEHDATGSTRNVPEEASPEKMSQDVEVLLLQMQELRKDFDTKLKYDASKERLVDALHQELQVYREGLHFKILRPLFIDLISMYDDLGKLIDTMQTETVEMSNNGLMKQNLQSFQENIEDILRRNNVDAFEAEETTFTASKQRILKVVNTQDAMQDKQIARRVRKGFMHDSKILRPELVETYKYIQYMQE